MSRTIEFLVNYMCPYARRGLYAQAFKGVEAEIIEIDFTNKSDLFIAVSPNETVPVLIIHENGKQYHIFESLPVAEFFDSYPGPGLYPRLENGEVNRIFKGIVDAHIQVYIQPFMLTMFQLTWTERSDEKMAAYIEKTRTINEKILSNGGYFMSGVIEYNEPTLADIVFLAHMDYLDALVGLEPALVEGEKAFPNLWTWYERMQQLPWVHKAKQPRERIMKMIMGVRNKTLGGLRAPVTFYDTL